MRLWTLVLSIQPSHLPNYTIFACFARTQTQTIFHITKLLVDWRQNVLADALYLLMKDGCDQFKILNSEVQVLKHLGAVWYGSLCNIFLVFKQHSSYFHILFHPHIFPKNTNNVTRTTLPNSPLNSVLLIKLHVVSFSWL